MSQNQETKDLTPIVAYFNHVTAVSPKSGKPYSCLDLVLTNGYRKRLFLEQAEMFMVESLLGITEKNEK